MTAYQLVIVHDDEHDWADEVERRVRAACARVLRHDRALVRLESVAAATGTNAPSAVVFLATSAGAASGSVVAELEAAREEAFPVLPIAHPGQRFEDVLPPPIRRLNALHWDGGPEAEMAVLRFLGLVEADRRLFLSYRRAETNSLAVQLRRTLSERVYDVFLDRFSVPPGDDFQRRINIELADKAFVLVLESESAIGSEWVQHEIVYALSHHIGVLALTMPGTKTEHQFEVIDDAFRMRLRKDDFQGPEGTSGVLKEGSLQRVLDEVEFRYAREVRRRRLQLLAAAGDFLNDAGYVRVPLDEWAYFAQRDSERLVVLVTPNAPSPRELRRADVLRQRVDDEMGEASVRLAYLVHDSPDRDPDTQALVDWIVAGRPLDTAAVADLPGLIS